MTMYQIGEWVEFVKPYQLQLTPKVYIQLIQGEKGSVQSVEDGLWIKLHHRDMTIQLDNDIVDDYIRLVTY
jgi:hypothetical protein